MDRPVCEFCNSTFKNAYILKSHIQNNKACLKSRGLVLDTPYVCKGCSLSFTNGTNLSVHEDICKKYYTLHMKEDYDYIIGGLQKKMNEKDEEITQLKKDKDLIQSQYQSKYESQISEMRETINKLHTTIESLAKEAINKPTTTNNTVNNTIRNQLSPTYTLDKITDKQLEDTFRSYMTEQMFWIGQKALAKMCVERIIKTKDGKMLICCSDISRKKFKLIDAKGNLKEDIEARFFTERVSVPIKNVGKDIYDCIMESISDERETISEDDYSKKDSLMEKSMKAMTAYLDIINIDDDNRNGVFKSELAALSSSL